MTDSEAAFTFLPIMHLSTIRHVVEVVECIFAMALLYIKLIFPLCGLRFPLATVDGWDLQFFELGDVAGLSNVARMPS
jgi:hypothetical protein